ncbi:MAG: hypothetical protein JW910_20810, partial [Anaerolineae bacterium]|nr:hypothetical protein [Anaerolineae bacterium]
GAYVVMGLFGWSGVWRALCAMGIGPLLASALIGVWWLARRPTLVQPAHPAGAQDPDRTEISRRTMAVKGKDRMAGESPDSDDGPGV